MERDSLRSLAFKYDWSLGDLVVKVEVTMAEVGGLEAAAVNVEVNLEAEYELVYLDGLRTELAAELVGATTDPFTRLEMGVE